MKLVQNTGADRVIDLIRPKFRPGGQLDVVSPALSLFAFAEILPLVKTLGKSRLLLPPESADLQVLGSEFDRPSRNQLQSRWLANRLIQWLQDKTDVRSTSGPIPQGAIVLVVVSAYSVDNLAPPMPTVITHEDTNGTRIIYVNDPGIPDLYQLCVFRGDSAFVPVTPIHCTTDLWFQETDLNRYFYRVQFSDTHGNVSEFSEEIGFKYPTGFGGAVLPPLFMRQNQPNPFNPFTLIEFTMPERSVVHLGIYDVSGRLIRELIRGKVLDRGTHHVTWDGQDSRGRLAPAAVYFYRLSAGDQEIVKRMVLVK